MNTEVLAAIAERVNRLDAVGVTWDRCVLLDNEGVVYGWIEREDGRSDFVIVNVSWGRTRSRDDKHVDWFAVGFSTSSALHSALIQVLLSGSVEGHTDCERVEDVFGALVNRKVVLA